MIVNRTVCGAGGGVRTDQVHAAATSAAPTTTPAQSGRSAGGLGPTGVGAAADGDASIVSFIKNRATPMSEMRAAIFPGSA